MVVLRYWRRSSEVPSLVCKKRLTRDANCLYLRHARPRPGISPPTTLLYVQKIGPTVRSNCTYRCHFALLGHFLELYVQKIGLSLHSNCTYITHFALLGHFCELYVQQNGPVLHSSYTYRLDNLDPSTDSAL